MARYLGHRILLAAIVIFGVTAVVFVALRLSGDPVALLLPPDAKAQDYENLRRILGLDRSIGAQYARYVTRFVQGDFGVSFTYRQPAFALVVERLPATFKLAAATFVLVILFSVPIGIVSALLKGSSFDYGVAVLTLAGQSMPNYWFAAMLILVFAVGLGWLPTSGSGSLKHLIMPAIALASQPASRTARLVRSEMLEILRQDYVRTARAKGVGSGRLLIVHALRNAAIPIVTLLGLDIGYLLGGAIVTETVFSWPGIGRLLIEAVSQRDFPVIQATVAFVACGVVIVNLIVDLSYLVLDPRVRLA